jgi:hypothetical protein
VKDVAVDQLVDLPEILLSFRQRPLVTASVNRSVTTLTSPCKLGL